jgi:uncharacterized protein
VGRSLLIDASHLERRNLEFDVSFEPPALSLPDNWKLATELHAEGVAELLDRHGSRTIRIKGRIAGRLENTCARCLRRLEETLGGDFELYYYPTSFDSQGEETSLSRDDADVGYYDEPGLPLLDAIHEQILLWLPMRGLCRDDCQGICPQCGVDRNEMQCRCRVESRDDRWAALRRLKLDDRN